MNRKKLAHYISTFGHPMLTFPSFIIIMLFTNERFEKAIWTSGLIIAGIFIPMFSKMFYGTKSGKYTNFDISDQQQRKSFYPFVLILLLLVITVLYATQQPEYILRALFFGFFLILVNYALNFYKKVSLHVSLTLFLGFLIFPIQPIIGAGTFLFSILMAWSRLELKRHTLKEIGLGTLVGIIIGGLYLLL